MAKEKKGAGSENSPSPKIEDALSYDDLLSGMASKILKMDPTMLEAYKENPGLIEVNDWMAIHDLPHFNALLGGGHPIGKITEIYGEFGTGKSTLAYKYLKACQEMGGVAILLDSEQSITLDRLEELGVNTEKKNFRYFVIDTVEKCDQMLHIFLKGLAEAKNKPLTTIVVDSLANLSTQKEIEAELTDQDVAWKARLINKMLRRITKELQVHDVNLIFCNQTYSKVGTMGFGAPQVETPGGKVFKFVATQRIECKKVGQIKVPEDPDPIGHIIELKTVKCRTARPMRKIRCAVINSEEGISGPWSVFYQLSWKERARAITAAGAYYSFTSKAKEAVPALPDKKFFRKDWPSVYEENREAIDELAVLSVNETF